MIDGTREPSIAALRTRLHGFFARRIRAEEVEDLLQETMLRVVKGLPSLADQARLGPFVYQIARHVLIDRGRQRGRSRETSVDFSEVESPFSDGEGDEESKESCELAKHIGAFVRTLPPPYRDVLELTELEGLSQRNAGVRLGMSETAVKSRVRRGRLLLRDALEDCCALEVDRRGGLIDVTPRPEGNVPADCCGGGVLGAAKASCRTVSRGEER